VSETLLRVFQALPEVLGERTPARLFQRRGRETQREKGLDILALSWEGETRNDGRGGDHRYENRRNQEIVHAEPFLDSSCSHLKVTLLGNQPKRL
jgi:hypothetical protein